MSDARTVLIVDDEDLVREAYQAFFARRTDFVVCDEARTGAEAVAAYARHRPDVVLMDLQMPVMSGIDATAAITKQWPEAVVVAITTFSTRDHIVAALRAGAAGYLVKDTRPEAFVSSLNQALAGDMPLSASVRRELVASVAAEREAPDGVHLTPREREVVAWLAHGLTNAEIAAKMYLSEGSVKQYLFAIGEKMGLRSRTQILMRAVQLGLVDPHALPPIGATP